MIGDSLILDNGCGSTSLIMPVSISHRL